jgi:tetratricopeptide (TPR) repeat protein
MSPRYAEASLRSSAGRARPLLAAAMIAALGATMLGGCASPGGKPAATDAAKPATSASPAIDENTRSDYTAALAAMKSGNWKDAQTRLQALVTAHPELPGPLVNLGIADAHLDQPDDARKLLEQAATQGPDFAPGQHQLALLLRGLGKFEDADAALARAQAADPADALACYDRAVLNELYLQRPDVALANYEKFQQLQPIPDKQVAAWIEDLKRRTNAAQPAAKTAAKGEPSS